MFAALRVAATLSVISAAVAEFVAAENGLGYLIAFLTPNFHVARAYGALGVLMALGLLLFQAVSIAQRTSFPWSLPKSHR